MNEEQKYDVASILLVEDDGPSRFYASTLLKKVTDKLFTAENGAKGLEIYKKEKPDIIVSDIGMPVMNGLTMSEKIKAIDPKAQIILATAFDNRESFIRAIDIGISQYILKPLKKESLLKAVERVKKVIKLEKEIKDQYDHIQKLSGAVEHSPSMVIIINEEIIEYINPKFQEITGFPEEELVGKDISFLLERAEAGNSNDTSKKISEFYDRIRNSKQIEWQNDFIFRKKDNEKFWASVSVSSVIDSEEKYTHSVIQMEDITERVMAQMELQNAHDQLELRVKERTAELSEANVKLEEEIEVRKRTEHDLRLAKEAAEAANKAKSSFLAKVSHELRTPLNGIIGLTSILLGTDIDEKQEKFLKMVRQSANNLLKIINDILDYSKIESGKLTISKSPMSIEDVIDSTVQLHEHSFRQKGLGLEVEIDENIPESVMGDPDRRRQILVNLISNALKFTEKGEVAVRSKLIKSNEDKVTVRFSVSDTGIGIPKNKVGELFKSFSQIDGSFTRKYGGTGLGLSICKELVVRMGGKINVKSNPGEGTAFYFDVPFEIARVEEKETKIEKREVKEIAARCPDFQANILVAEDSIINQEVIKQVFSYKNWNVMMASSGREAVELFESMDFDVIFMDIQMPEMDGIKATEMIREREKNGEHVSIIGLSAHGFDIQKDECIAAGMDYYIVKPIDWEKVFSLICRIKGYDHDKSKKDIDVPKLINTIGGNKVVLKRIIDYFINNIPSEMEELNKAIENKDYYSLKRKAHKMKSELGNFHAVKSVDIAKKLENMGENKNIEKAYDHYADLVDEIEKIKRTLINERNKIE